MNLPSPKAWISLDSRARGLVIVGLTALPLASLVLLVALYAHDIPSSDDWDLVPLIEKQTNKSLTFQDLWQPYAQHQIFVGKLIMLALAAGSHWNLYYQYALNLLCAVGTLWAIASILGSRGKTTLNAIHWMWLLPACSLIVFSLNGWVNYFWGWTFHCLLSVCAIAWGISFLLPLKPFRFVSSMVLGWVATCSFGNGFLFWPAAGFVLLAQALPPKKKMAYLGALVLSGAVVTFLVLRQIDFHENSLASPTPDVAKILLYVLNFLGNPLAPPHFALAIVFGTSGLALFIVLSGRVMLNRNPTAIQLIALGGYSVLSAGMIGMSRIKYGLIQGSDPRYYPIACIFWVSIITLLYLDPFCAKGATPRRIIYGAILCILSLSLLRSTPQLRNIRAFSQQQMAARSALLYEQNDRALAAISTARVNVQEIKVRNQYLREHHLSLHRTP